MKFLKCCKGRDKDFMLPWKPVKKLIHALKQATMVEEAPSAEGEALLQAVLGAAKRHWWAAKCWKPKAMMGKGMGKGKCWAPSPEHADWWAAKKAMAKGMGQEALQKEASALIQDIMQALKQYWTAVKSDWQQEHYTPDAYMQATKDFMKFLKCCKAEDKDFMLPWKPVKKLIHALKQATMVEEAPSTEGEALLQAVRSCEAPLVGREVLEAQGHDGQEGHGQGHGQVLPGQVLGSRRCPGSCQAPLVGHEVLEGQAHGQGHGQGLPGKALGSVRCPAQVSRH